MGDMRLYPGSNALKMARRLALSVSESTTISLRAEVVQHLQSLIHLEDEPGRFQVQRLVEPRQEGQRRKRLEPLVHSLPAAPRRQIITDDGEKPAVEA